MQLQTVRAPKLLKLAAYDDPVLHHKTAAVDFPLSLEDQQLIADMIYSIQPKQLKAANAPWEQAVGMAANQWGVSKSIFLYCPSGDSVNNLEVIINPSYTTVLSGQEQEWEGCFSVPLATGNIQRATTIQVKYQNTNGDIIEGEISGWPARVWQHENDHLNGFLYDSKVAGKCLDKRQFKTLEEVEEFYAQLRKSRDV